MIYKENLNHIKTSGRFLCSICFKGELMRSRLTTNLSRTNTANFYKFFFFLL